MINLLAYSNKSKKFDNEHLKLTKIQIDNSLDLGWDQNKIILATNFDFQHNGIKSINTGNDKSEPFDPRMAKIDIICNLFDKKLIEDNETYWFHDFDAFQINTFNESDVNLNSFDIGLTNYSHKKRNNAGSFFFTGKSIDIFKFVQNYIYNNKDTEENAFNKMIDNNLDIINGRYKIMDIGYNLGIYNIPNNYILNKNKAKVIHFHPSKPRHLLKFEKLIPDRLSLIFKKYEI